MLVVGFGFSFVFSTVLVVGFALEKLLSDTCSEFLLFTSLYLAVP